MSGVDSEQSIPKWVSIVCGVIFLIVAVVGFLENIMVLYVFVTTNHLRSPTNYFIATLAAVDLLMAVTAVPLAAYSGFVGYWVFGDVMCIIEGWFVYCFSLTSMYLLAALSVDRFIRIVKASTAHMITQRVAFIAVVFCFFGGAFWSVLPLLGLGSYALEPSNIVCGLDWKEPSNANKTYVGCVFIFCFLIPAGTMFYCYFRTVCFLRYFTLLYIV